MIIIPMYIFGTIIFIICRNNILIQSKEISSIQTKLYFVNLENEMKKIQNIKSQLLNDSDLNAIMQYSSNGYTFENVMLINSLRSKLTIIKDTSDYINMISIYLPSFDILINSSGNNVSYEELSNIDKDRIYDILKKGNKDGVLDENMNIFYSQSKKGTDSTQMPLFIEISLSKDKITSVLEKYKIYNGSKYYLKFNNSNLIYTNDTDNSRLINNLTRNNNYEKEKFIKIENIEYMITKDFSDFLNAEYIQLIPKQNVLRKINMLIPLYAIFTLFVLIMMFFYYIYAYKYIKKPIDVLLLAFKEVKEGKFNESIIYSNKEEFSTVYNSFNDMIELLDNLVSQVYKQKILAQKAELRQLQSQINPHFLYNSFYILKRKIKKENFAQALIFCEMLGSYFEYITKNYDDYTELSSEIKHARLYSEIQALRFSNRLTLIFDDLPEKYSKLKVPRLIVQPLIENSFKYGLEDKETEAILKVTFEENEESLKIIVEDNGTIPQSSSDKIEDINKLLDNIEEIKEPSGLLNIHKRIKLYKKNYSGIKLYKSELGGLKVVLILSLGGDVID